jgi:uncharacterized protein (TIGR03000 family)
MCDGITFQGERTMYAKVVRFIVGAVAVTALIAAVRPGAAQEQGWPLTHPTGSSSFPWNAPDYRGYEEPLYVTQEIGPSAPAADAQKYEMNAQPLPMVKNTMNSNAVTIVAHVPENAQVWFFDTPTTSKGKTRVYQYPNLAPGSKYSYTVRIAWMEDGKVVSQTQTFPVTPGEVHAIYLKRSEGKKSAG